MRQKFEIWYCAQFLYAEAKQEARRMVRELRNVRGGYDDDHMEGAWYTFKYFGGKNVN